MEPKTGNVCAVSLCTVLLVSYIDISAKNQQVSLSRDKQQRRFVSQKLLKC